jgi:hypothetical protein
MRQRDWRNQNACRRKVAYYRCGARTSAGTEPVSLDLQYHFHGGWAGCSPERSRVRGTFVRPLVVFFLLPQSFLQTRYRGLPLHGCRNSRWSWVGPRTGLSSSVGWALWFSSCFVDRSMASCIRVSYVLPWIFYSLLVRLGVREYL